MTKEKLHELLGKFAESQGISLNKDENLAKNIIAGLLVNESRFGYRACPCRLAVGDKEEDKDIICPCAYRDDDLKEYGSCYCQLYVTHDWNEGKIEHRATPERRPLDKLTP
jgi:ferredoxin-thioredoxin reductase catalytic subunit